MYMVEITCAGAVKWVVQQLSRPKRDRVTGCGIRTVWRGRRGVDVSRG
jgi:hypothetical protein